MRVDPGVVPGLMLSACGSPANQPASSSPSTTPSSSPVAPVPAAVDCTKPANSAQQLICTDSHLFDLERQLQAAYQQALTRPGTEQSAVAAAQAGWETTPDNCANNPD